MTDSTAGPKFGVAYSVYDGEELLPASLRAMRPHADYVAVVYSEYSYYGEPASPRLAEEIESLRALGLVDEVLHFEPEGFAVPGDRARRREIEVAKRNAGLDLARAAGCDYFMTMNTDEFYDADALERAKRTIVSRGVTHSFVHILNYGREPTQLSNMRKWEYFVPFWAKVTPESTLGKEGEKDKAPCLVDSTRIMSYGPQARDYVLEDIFMHHYTRVRGDLAAKYASRKVTSAVDEDWIDLADQFITVPDYFDLARSVRAFTSGSAERAPGPGSRAQRLLARLERRLTRTAR